MSAQRKDYTPISILKQESHGREKVKTANNVTRIYGEMAPENNNNW